MVRLYIDYDKYPKRHISYNATYTFKAFMSHNKEGEKESNDSSYSKWT